MPSQVSKPLWLQLIDERVEQLGSIQAVADEIGYARVSLSLAMRGKYVGSTERLEKKVMQTLGRFICPHLERELSLDECVFFRKREAPTQNPVEMRHWRACQHCQVGYQTTKKGKTNG